MNEKYAITPSAQRENIFFFQILNFDDLQLFVTIFFGILLSTIIYINIFSLLLIYVYQSIWCGRVAYQMNFTEKHVHCAVQFELSCFKYLKNSKTRCCCFFSLISLTFRVSKTAANLHSPISSPAARIDFAGNQIKQNKRMCKHSCTMNSERIKKYKSAWLKMV